MSPKPWSCTGVGFLPLPTALRLARLVALAFFDARTGGDERKLLSVYLVLAFLLRLPATGYCYGVEDGPASASSSG